MRLSSHNTDFGYCQRNKKNDSHGIQSHRESDSEIMIKSILNQFDAKID